MEFHDQIVLVCGTVNRLGQLIAEAALKRGALKVVLVGNIASTSQFQQSGHGELICVPDDALDDPQGSIDSIKQFGRIDTVVNLVTLADSPPISPSNSTSTTSELISVFDAVSRRTARVVEATRELLQRSRPHGVIVNVGWFSSEAGRSMPVAASAAFASLETLTHLHAKELAPHIRVNSVFSEELAATSQPPFTPAHDAYYIRSPDESIGPILFLASSAARHITGTVLTANRGRRLGFGNFSNQNEGISQPT